MQIPTFGAAEGRFVYALPPEPVDDEADLRLRARAALILARYRELRASAPADDLAAWRGIVDALRAGFAASVERRATAHRVTGSRLRVPA